MTGSPPRWRPMSWSAAPESPASPPPEPPRRQAHASWSWKRAPRPAARPPSPPASSGPARDLAGWLSVQPGGDPTLGKALVTTYPEAIQWLRTQDVRLDPFEFGESGWNPAIPLCGLPARAPKMTAVQIRRAAMDRLTANVADAGGRIFTENRHPRVPPGRRRTRHRCRGPADPYGRHPHNPPEPRLWPTGGFQGSPELRARYFGPNSDRMILRANPYSTGEAFQAATGRRGRGSCWTLSVASTAIVSWLRRPRR